MAWWLGPSIIGVIVAGILAGLLITYFISRKQKKYDQISLKTDLPNVEKPAESYHRGNGHTDSFTTQPPSSRIAEVEAKPVIPGQNRVEEYLSQRKSAPIVKTPAGLPKSDALLELENNLAISTRPVTDKLESFQTSVWNTRRNEFSQANRELIGDLTEVYVDMLLANNIVWLVTELGRDSKDLTSNYLKLSNKIAERLQRIMPAVRDTFK